MVCHFPLQGVLETFSCGSRKWKPSVELYKLFSQGVSLPEYMDEGRSCKVQAVPCGRCVGCRLDRSRQWAVRAMHEASLHEDNCFLTLTFDNEHLPNDGSIDRRDVQLFLKRLRKKYDYPIRMIYCGEYGEKFLRPHYHLLLFGHDFSDKVLWKQKGDFPLYISEELSSLWKFGYSVIGALTFETAAYVSRYCMKKINGSEAFEHYSEVDYSNGVLTTRQPEFFQASLKPGIAKSWFDKNKSEVYPSDEVIVNGKPCKPPRYYDRCFEIDHPEGMEAIKLIREKEAKNRADDSTCARLKVRNTVCRARIKSLIRGYEVSDETQCV